MLRYEVPCDAPDAAWALLAQPGRWHEWAPHVRGAWGLGEPEVEIGRSGFVRLVGVVPVPAKIINKGTRSWTWRVGGAVTMDHVVTPDTLTITLSAPPPLERALGAAYGPVIRLMLRRLSRTATARPRPTRTGSPAG
ncbi:SRPBCC family protein [Conexibacter woesei]|uniref:SRPBCC family protein n=1 Tax=Conexibacter woesei TaxID=191495 RepID=UPI0009DC1689|nr:SRPBCC family protein [Conexibacter woesei]